MSTTTDTIAPLVAHTREQYLRKEESRIRSAATTILAGGPDPGIRAALDAVIYAEDLHDIHDVTAAYYRDRGIAHKDRTHVRYAASAWQLKLRALDQLAHLVV
jgi:hypothetical protein